MATKPNWQDIAPLTRRNRQNRSDADDQVDALLPLFDLGRPPELQRNDSYRLVTQ
jgi:hypothetical protein